MKTESEFKKLKLSGIWMSDHKDLRGGEVHPSVSPNQNPPPSLRTSQENDHE